MEEPTLRLEWLDPSELQANPSNWRRHPSKQKLALRATIQEVGWAGALLYNEQTQKLIDGHARKELFEGKGPVPVLIGSWDEATEKKILATLDPLAAMAEADKDSLDKLLREVQTGDEDLANMLTELAQDNGIISACGGPLEDDVAPIDKAAELQEKWGTATGQLWVIPSKTVPGKAHRLLCGDSTKAEDVTKVMAGEKAGLMATDPPYGVDYVQVKAGIPRPGYSCLDRDYKDIEADDFKDEKLQAFLESAFRSWLPHLDHAGWYLWHAHLTQGFFSAAAAAAAANVVLHRQIIWVKSGFNLTRSGMYHWAHEPCFFGWVKGEQPPWYGEKNQRSVWEIARHEGKGLHPTQKPTELWKAPMENHTKPGDICAEPFSGSGSQFIAGEQLGRLVYGIEIEPKYVAVALERLATLGLEPQGAD